MFKAMKAELKKMVAKPGIYVLVVLLAIVLVLGVFVYNPSKREIKNKNIAEETFMSTLSKYIDNYKIDIDENIDIRTNRVNSYITEGKTKKEVVYTQYDNFSNAYNDFKESLIVNNKNYTDICKSLMIDCFKTLNETITNGINSSSKNTYLILSSGENYEKYSSTYEECLNLFESGYSNNIICTDFESLYQADLTNSIKSFIFPTLSNYFIFNYTKEETNSNLSIVKTRLNEINTKINTLNLDVQADYDKNLDKSYINTLVNLINEYINTGKTYIDLVDLELLNNAFSFTSTSQQINLLYLSNESEYNTKSLLMKQSYLFETNKNNESYALPLTIGLNSNKTTNAYDYAYFTLRLFSFIIVVYAIMCICNAIAGEIKDGTMRYFAIRPISRTHLILGKMLATIVMSVILIIFSSIIALCVGGAFYGFNSLNILTIFNSSKVIVVHPIVMILFYILSFIFELVVYVSIAMLLSCLIKSDLLSLTLMILLYLINILLPVFAGGINSWLAFYPFSHISLYSLFGSSIYLDTSNTINNMLGAHIYAGTSLGLTLIIIVGISSIFTLISSLIFKRKEL